MIAEPFQLEVTPDRPRLDPLDAAPLVELEAGRPFGQHEVSIHRVGESLETEGPGGSKAEGAPHQSVRIGGDDNPTRWRRRLQPAGAVDRFAHHHLVLSRPAVDPGNDDFTGVDPDAGREVDPVLPGKIRSKYVEMRPERQCGSNRLVRVVLLGTVQTENGHYCVSDELLDHPTPTLDLGAPSGETGIEE